MKIDRSILLNHIFEDDKKVVLRNLIDKLETVINKHIVVSTDFLDPYEVYLSKSILNKFDEIKYTVSGGYDSFERSIIYVYPSYLYDIDCSDIKKLSFKENNEDIKHKNVLGSLMSLGIDRKKIGDIVFSNGYCHIFLKSEISEYVKYNLTKVNQSNVKSEENIEFIAPILEYELKKIIISSLRLDTFIGAILKISRANATSLIETKKVKVNFKDETKPSIKLNQGDLISIKKYGRFIFADVEQITKKDKYVINIKIPK